MSTVAKNLMVRVGADLSRFNSSFSKAAGTTGNFGKQAKAAIREVAEEMRGLKIAAIEDGKSNAGIVSLTDQIRNLKEEQKALESMGFSWGYNKYEENAAQLRSLTAQLEEYKASLNATPEESVDDLTLRLWEAVEATDGLGAKLQVAKDALKQMEARGLGAGDEDWDNMYRSVNLLTNAVNDYKKSLEGAADNTQEIATVSKRASSSTDGLASSLKRIGIVSIGIRLTQAVMGRLRSIVSGYISENATLQAQVTALKNSMGQALAPAINLVTNALSALMPYIVGVSNAIGSLIANLFGSGWTTVVDGANDAADAIGGAGSAQKEFNRQLAGFDEITKLNGDSSGGGGGGSSSSTTPIEGVMPTWLSSLTQQVQEAAANGDFCGIGAAIANAINNGITGFDTTAGSLGTKLAEWINNGVAVANGLIQNVDWSSLWTSLIDGASNFFSGLLGNLDWAGIFELMGSIAGIRGPGEAIWNKITESITSAYDDFKEDLEAQGGNIWAAIGQGILNSISDIGTWIKDNIFTPFVNGFTKTFTGSDVPLSIDLRANLTSWKDSLSDKVTDFKANMTVWQNSLNHKIVDFKANMTVWQNSLTNKVVNFKANLTAWQNSLTNKVVNFTAKLTSWTDALGSKLLEFKANVKKNWTGSLADKLGISSITTTLNMKVPKISIDWGSVTAFGKTYQYPKGFKITWNAKGAILDGAQLFGRVGNTFLGGGEAGREAVLPLDRNTGWMDKIADRVALKVITSQTGSQEITINLVLDGKVITKTVVRNINAQARATGKNPLADYL